MDKVQFEETLSLIKSSLEDLNELREAVQDLGWDADLEFKNLALAVSNNITLLEYIYEDIEGVITYFLIDLDFGVMYDPANPLVLETGEVLHLRDETDLYNYLNEYE